MEKENITEKTTEEQTPHKKTTAKKPKIEKSAELKGVVVNCQKLNVRNAARNTAKVIGTISCNTAVVIDMEKSSDTFYKIRTEKGLEGFCMRSYIQLRN